MGNTGQMLLVLGALVLFSLMLPSMNQTILYNDRTLISTNAELTAISLAEKIIAEAGTKAFDVFCITGTPTSPSQLTSAYALGAAYGEVYPNFNDLDDYHNMSISDTTTFPSVPFNIAGQVVYINPANPNQTVNYQTYLKKLSVTVTSPYLINPASEQPVTVSLEQIFAYY
jgi:hypothetical protein